MTRKLFSLKAIAVFALLGLLAILMTSGMVGRPASEWQPEKWMQDDGRLPVSLPARVLALTDLPPLKVSPTPKDILAAIAKSKKAGCKGAVLTFSWPALEPREGEFTLADLEGAVTVNQGCVLYLGIQILNTTVKELPADLQDKRLDDPEVLRRFRSFLDGLAPLLRNRIRYLSIGNESDIYLSMYSQEFDHFRVFLEAARRHAKEISPDILVGTTLTDAGAMKPAFQGLVRHSDAHFLTYYHGQVGVDGKFKDTAKTKDEILALASQLDERSIVFQEIGFPADKQLSSPGQQAEFVTGVFDAWEKLGSRVPFLNYFMMYDFPNDFVKGLVAYYGVSDQTESLTRFLTSLGLHDADGTPRPSWQVFVRRGKQIE